MENDFSVKSKIFSGMAWQFLEKFSSKIVSFVVSLILARLLLPEEYGIVAIVLVFITIMDVVVTSGISASLIQKKEIDSLDYSSAFYANFIISIFLYLVLYLVSPIIADFYNNLLLTSLLRVMGIRILFSSIYSIQYAYVSRNMEFKKFFLSTLIGTSISAIIGVTMAYLNYGVWSLIVQYLSNTIINTIILFFVIKWKPTLEFSTSRLKTMLPFGFKILFTEVISTCYGDIRDLVIGKYYAGDQLAYFTKGKQFPQLLVVNINLAISTVMFPAMSHFQSNKEELIKIVKKLNEFSSYIIFPILVGLFCVADKLIIILLTEKWINAAIFLKIFAIIYMLWPLQTTNIQLLKSIGKGNAVLFAQIFYSVIGIISILISIKYGIIYVAISSIIPPIINIFVLLFLSKHYINIPISIQFYSVFKNFIISLIMGIVVVFIGNFNFNIYISFLFQIIIGIITYIILSILSKNTTFTMISKSVCEKLKKNKKTSDI